MVSIERIALLFDLHPSLTGVIIEFSNWRVMQIILAVAGAVGFLAIFLLYPETSHPGTRGIDKWRQKHGMSADKLHITFLNPLKTLALLRSPNLLMISLAGTGILLTDYGEILFVFVTARQELTFFLKFFSLLWL